MPHFFKIKTDFDLVLTFNQLGLLRCQNLKIGSPHEINKSLSGGEMRRLAFATEVSSLVSFLLISLN